MSRPIIVVSWLLQVLAAAILAQTLFFKFSGAAESRYIFETLGAEPLGRYAAGVTELIAVFLLLIPRTVVYGALLTVGVIAGALAAHLTRLGIVIMDDGGLLFGLAIVVFAASSLILVIRRAEIPIVGRRFRTCAASSGI